MSLLDTLERVPLLLFVSLTHNLVQEVGEGPK